MFKALANTIWWTVSDQRKRLREGFGDDDVFELDMILPLYASGHLARDSGFRQRRIVFVRDPKLFGLIFKASETELDAGSAYSFVKPYFGEQSVLVEQGADHLHAKQAVYNVIRQNMKIGTDELMFFGYSIDEIFKSGTYPVLRRLQLLAGAFVLRTIFGEQGSALADETIQHAIAETQHVSGVLLVVPALARWARFLGIGLALRRERLALRKFINKEMSRTTLDDWRSPDGKVRPPGRREIVDNLMTILIAGFETTATTIAWLLYELASHRDVQIALRNEVLEHIREKPIEYLTDDDTLLAACVFEIMRLHPALPFAVRQAPSDYALGEVTARAGDYIVLAIEEMHWRHFGAEGMAFRPERFRGSGQLPHLATFGGGTKTCPGRMIATQEVRTIAALIVAAFNLSLADATDPRISRNRVSASPRGGMVLTLDRITG